MHRWSAALLALVACSAPAAPSPAPSPSPPPPAVEPASVAAPAPDAEVERDPREIGFVSGYAAYESGGTSVHRDLSDDHEQTIADCFERTMPLERREPTVYYVHVFVADPDHDPDKGYGGYRMRGAAGGMAYPPRGTYPDFEACVAAAIPEYRAPSDVSLVEIRKHIHTVAEAMGSFGRGGGGP
jgi:hypothetical protein